MPSEHETTEPRDVAHYREQLQIATTALQAIYSAALYAHETLDGGLGGGLGVALGERDGADAHHEQADGEGEEELRFTGHVLSDSC